ncbi:diguanylate cyclase [Chitinibacter bivalviorum]|uniref:diguanylate cyclase n=1 Tax=Chitinibacter bivalviorum TaxID=2739434 RepID=A0A7H9BDW8_9NEIS|nr:diguanylate cyclase [Chitinibacter bivalviorum]QLG86755.1 diguanylate cyclase [Chitinibacter bivalviorum]
MKNDSYILVVDDQMANIESLGESLADQYDVRFALSGQSALEVIAKSKPDLILLDIMMPDMNGYEVCRVLQSHPDTAQIPVIFITALATPEEETQGLDAGAVDYIVKPFNPSIVRARVRNHLALKYANDQLRVLSLTDSLTGLANRRHLFERLSSEIEHLQAKPETEPFAIILIDIDYFKRYNDTYGHVAGDFCLQRVAGVIRSALRSPADLTARYGGEEFCCLLHQATLDEARQIAERISQSVADLEIPHLGAYERQFVTVSAGVAQWQPHMAHIESVLQAADEALYAAKATGRNKVVCKV